MPTRAACQAVLKSSAKLRVVRFAQRWGLGVRGASWPKRDLLSRGSQHGAESRRILKGHLRAVDTSKHLYMVAEGAARVVLDGEAVPAPSDAPPGPSDGTESGQLAAVSSDGSERLEPLRVFVIRRNGTGYELHAADAAAAAMQRARRAGQMVLEETRGDAGWCTHHAPDDHGLIHRATPKGSPPSLRASLNGRQGRGKEESLEADGARLQAAGCRCLRRAPQACSSVVRCRAGGAQRERGDDSPFVVKVEAIHAQRNVREDRRRGWSG